MSGGSGGNVCHRLVCRCHSLSKARPGVVIVGGPALSPLKTGGAGGTYMCKRWVCVRMCVRSAAYVCAHLRRCVCVCVCVCVAHGTSHRK